MENSGIWDDESMPTFVVLRMWFCHKGFNFHVKCRNMTLQPGRRNFSFCSSWQDVMDFIRQTIEENREMYDSYQVILL